MTQPPIFFRESQHIPGCSTHASWDELNPMEAGYAHTNSEAPGAKFASDITQRKRAAIGNRFRHVEYSFENPNVPPNWCRPNSITIALRAPTRPRFSISDLSIPEGKQTAAKRPNDTFYPMRNHTRSLVRGGTQKTPVFTSGDELFVQEPSVLSHRSSRLPSPGLSTLVPPDTLIRPNSIHRQLPSPFKPRACVRACLQVEEAGLQHTTTI